MFGRAPVAPLVLALGVMHAVAARADSGEQLAQACYNAVNAGRLELACKICEEAVGATSDAHTKSAALMNLARCEESRGQLVHALDHYRAARELMAPEDPRGEAVDGRIAELGPRIGQLRLRWESAPANAVLLIDGVAVAGHPAELAIDPGERAIEVRSPGREPRRDTLHISDGGDATVRVRIGRRSPSPPVAVDPGDGQRIAAFVVGGLGAAGMIAFAITGGLSVNRHNTVEELCPEAADGVQRCTDQRGLDAADDGKKLGIANAVSLGVGVAGLVTGLILYLTAPRGESQRSAEPTTPVAWALRSSPTGGVILVTGVF